MIFRWESEKQKILRGSKISVKKKLEGMRLMNEMSDKVLTKRQKRLRRQWREK